MVETEWLAAWGLVSRVNCRVDDDQHVALLR